MRFLCIGESYSVNNMKGEYAQLVLVGCLLILSFDPMNPGGGAGLDLPDTGGGGGFGLVGEFAGRRGVGVCVGGVGVEWLRIPLIGP